jgi:hypothetical protein
MRHREIPLKELDRNVVRIVILRRLSRLSIINDLKSPSLKLLQLHFQNSRHLKIVLVVNLTPVDMLALLSLLQADVLKCIENLSRRGSDMTRCLNDTVDIHRLLSTRAQNTSFESLLSLNSGVPLFELDLVEGETVVVPTDVLDSIGEIGVLSTEVASHLGAEMDHLKQLLLPAVDVNLLLDTVLLLLDVAELLRLLLGNVVESNGKIWCCQLNSLKRESRG